MTLIEFYNEFFLINLKDYPNIKINLEINKVLLCFLIGTIVTMIIYNYRNSGNINLIKKLLRYESFDEESAKNLDELGLNTFNSRLSLSGNGRIRKIVKRVGETEMSYEEYVEAVKSKEYKEEKIDFTTAKFYISKEATDDATRLAESTNSSLLSTILFCILLIAIYVCVSLFMPSILTFINNLLG